MIRRLVLGVKRAVITDISMLKSHFLLVTVLRILLIKFINHALFDRHFIYSLFPGGFGCIDFDINLGSDRAKIWVKALPTPHGMVWIEYVKWL